MTDNDRQMTLAEVQQTTTAYLWCCDSGFAASDGSGQNGTSFIVTRQNFGHTSMANSEEKYFVQRKKIMDNIRRVNL